MSLNPNAKSFSFRPSAAPFVPGGAVEPEQQPEPQPEPVAPVQEPEPEPVVVEEPEPEPVVEEEPVQEEQVEEVEEEVDTAAPSAGAVSKSSVNAETPADFHDKREHLNVVFIGHVDAGKSTISGQILLLTGQVDERIIEKYTREAKERNRDSWYLAFIMDTNEEERARGKTVEVGRAHFATANKRYTLLDAPGHKNYVPNMISGAAQADVGILIISARRGEFESGFDRGGQSREHTMLAKTLGVQRLVVAINKMDESTVEWSQARYDQIVKKLTPFLKKKAGYKSKDISFLPISGLTGANLMERVDKSVCPWYDGPSLIEILDTLEPIDRGSLDAPMRMPVLDRYKDRGSVAVLGKVESGVLRVDQKLLVQPNGMECEVVAIEIEDEEVPMARPGENVVVKVRGIDEDFLHGGYVLGDAEHPPRRCLEFTAQLVVIDLLPHKPIMTSGYEAVLHVHTLAVECEVKALLGELNKKTGKKKRGPCTFVKNGSICKAKIAVEQSIAIELYDDVAQLGRFTLRDEGKTIAIGKIIALSPMPEE